MLSDTLSKLQWLNLIKQGESQHFNMHGRRYQGFLLVDKQKQMRCDCAMNGYHRKHKVCLFF